MSPLQAEVNIIHLACQELTYYIEVSGVFSTFWHIFRLFKTHFGTFWDFLGLSADFQAKFSTFPEENLAHFKNPKHHIHPW